MEVSPNKPNTEWIIYAKCKEDLFQMITLLLVTGGIFQDGTWDGGIKDIMDGVADIAAAFFTVTYLRSTAVDFTLQIHEIRNHFFLKSPKAAFSWTSFLKPFNPTTWYILLIMIIICALSLAIMAKLAKDKNSSEFSFSKSFIYSFGAYCAISARRFVN